MLGSQILGATWHRNWSWGHLETSWTPEVGSPVFEIKIWFPFGSRCRRVFWGCLPGTAFVVLWTNIDPTMHN